MRTTIISILIMCVMINCSNPINTYSPLDVKYSAKVFKKHPNSSNSFYKFHIFSTKDIEIDSMEITYYEMVDFELQSGYYKRYFEEPMTDGPFKVTGYYTKELPGIYPKIIGDWIIIIYGRKLLRNNDNQYFKIEKAFETPTEDF